MSRREQLQELVNDAARAYRRCVDHRTKTGSWELVGHEQRALAVLTEATQLADNA